ncbi:MAG: pectate lyase [Rhodocyclaceae bacterium]
MKNSCFLLVLCLLLIGPTHADVPVPSARISASGAAPGYSASQAADANPDTRWVAESTDGGNWLALSFAEPVLVTALRISEPQPRVRAWRVEVQRDGRWRQVLAGSGLPQGKLAIPPSLTEGVRLSIDSTRGGAAQVSEFAAWASGRSACVPPTGEMTLNVAREMDCAGLVISQPCNRLGPAGPLFVLADGAILRNVTLIDSYVSCDGACTLENVHWRINCPSVVQQSAVIQSVSESGGRDINIVGGSAFGRYGALFRINTTASTLNLRQFVFSGYGETINAFAPDTARQMRLRLDEVSLAGTLRGGVVQVRPDKQDHAWIRRLRIAGYRRGNPLVCNLLGVQQERLMSFGEQWQSDVCDIGPDDVQAVKD